MGKSSAKSWRRKLRLLLAFAFVIGMAWWGRWAAERFLGRELLKLLTSAPVGVVQVGQLHCDILWGIFSIEHANLTISDPLGALTVEIPKLEGSLALGRLFKQQLAVKRLEIAPAHISYQAIGGPVFKVQANLLGSGGSTDFPANPGEGWRLLLGQLTLHTDQADGLFDQTEKPLINSATLVISNLAAGLDHWELSGRASLVAHPAGASETGALIGSWEGSGRPDLFKRKAYLMLSNLDMAYFRPVLEYFDAAWPLGGLLNGELRFHCNQDQFQLTGDLALEGLQADPGLIGADDKIMGLIPLRTLAEAARDEGGRLSLDNLNITADWNHWRTALVYGIPGKLVKKYAEPILAKTIRDGSGNLAQWALQTLEEILARMTELTDADLAPSPEPASQNPPSGEKQEPALNQ